MIAARPIRIGLRLDLDVELLTLLSDQISHQFNHRLITMISRAE